MSFDYRFSALIGICFYIIDLEPQSPIVLMSEGTEASISRVRKDIIINPLLFSSESEISASKIIRHSSGNLKETNLCIKVLGGSLKKENTRQQKKNIHYLSQIF